MATLREALDASVVGAVHNNNKIKAIETEQFKWADRLADEESNIEKANARLAKVRSRIAHSPWEKAQHLMDEEESIVNYIERCTKRMYYAYNSAERAHKYKVKYAKVHNIEL